MTDDFEEWVKQQEPAEHIESRARAIARQIEIFEMMENEKPSTPQPLTPLRPLVDDLHAALSYNPNDPQDIILEHQARALDQAFRRLMLSADRTGESEHSWDTNLMQYAAAFKAQDQFRRTIKTLQDMRRQNIRNIHIFET